MAKIPTFSEVSIPDNSDLLYLVDVSDTTDDATGSSRKMTLSSLLGMTGAIPGGRLSGTSGVPVTTSDLTSISSIYYTPYIHNIIVLWDGSRWTSITFTETSLPLGTLTSGRPYDVFGRNNSGTLSIDFLAWTNTTTRATNISLQDGRYCKTGDKTRLYLGTFYTKTTTTTADSVTQRYLWNMYNRKEKPFLKNETTDSWTYSTATLRALNNSTANRIEFVIGLQEEPIKCSCQAGVLEASAGGGGAIINIGLDSTSVASGQLSSVTYWTATGLILHTIRAEFNNYSGVGYHFLQALESATVGGVVETFYGDAGNSGVSAGLSGSIKG